MIAGAGGNIGVQIGSDGIVLVNAGTAAASDQVLAALKKLTDLPIRYIINADAGPDFVGGNEKLAKAGYTIFTNALGNAAASRRHDQRRRRLDSLARQRAAPDERRTSRPTPSGALPTEAFFTPRKAAAHERRGHRGAVPAGGAQRRRQLRAVPRLRRRRHRRRDGHDAFPGDRLANGGSIQGEIDALNRLIDLTIAPTPFIYKDVGTYVIPGHGRLCEQMEVVDYRDMVVIVRDVVADLIEAGKTLDQIKAARPALPYETRYGAKTGVDHQRVRRGDLQEPDAARSRREAADDHRSWLARAAHVLGCVAGACPRCRPGAGPRGAAPPPPPQTPKAAAPIDLTGYWVSVVTEDWRYRMVTPANGDYQGVPMTPAARAIADAWDPAKEEASGDLCKSYGAPALLRVPGPPAHHLAGRPDAAHGIRRRQADAARFTSAAGRRPAGRTRSRATRSPSGKAAGAARPTAR